ncbi:hypothetical protein IC575_027018 [Cucumis melo]
MKVLNFFMLYLVGLEEDVFVFHLNTLKSPPIIQLKPKRFDDTNLEKLGRATQHNETNRETLFFDPKDINWENYFLNVHIPGLVKYVLK